MPISFKDDILPLKDKLYRLALRITLHHEEAEDIVQDALIKIWNARERWQEIESIEAFALTIVRNLSLDHLKRKGAHEDTIDEQTTWQTDSRHSPDRQAIVRDHLDIVREIIDRLPEKQRSAVQLRDIEGYSYKEIASILDITEDQVKVNIYRARQTIKTQFLNIERD